MVKKIITVAALVGLALVFQLVFSQDSASADNDKSGRSVPFNGITYFEVGGGSTTPEGSAAGGPGETSPSKELYNGITFFDTGSGAAPAKSPETGESTVSYNGITVFE